MPLLAGIQGFCLGQKLLGGCDGFREVSAPRAIERAVAARVMEFDPQWRHGMRDHAGLKAIRRTT